MLRKEKSELDSSQRSSRVGEEAMDTSWHAENLG